MPQGVISQLFREISAKRPGLITKVGLHTYIDPRIEGGKANELTKKNSESLIENIQIHGDDYLLYRAVPIDFAFIRGTTADTKGNVSMEKEANTLENLSIAQATRNSGGTVVVQVEAIAEENALPPRSVEIPHIVVDHLVVARPENHWQTFVDQYDPAISGQVRSQLKPPTVVPLDEKRIIGRRALMELRSGQTANLGIGIPEQVAQSAFEEGVFDRFTLTVESGLVGGIPLGGLRFGTGINFDAMIDQPYQFDFYDGGGLDIAFLGMAQTDEQGNVNVSKFGGRFVGCGGFINITQNAKRVIFVGTFTSKGLEVEIKEGKLVIRREVDIVKFVDKVDQITFSGNYAGEKEKEVTYITERAVFRLDGGRLTLQEIAPGIDLDRQVLEMMEFKPRISDDLIKMDQRILSREKLKLDRLLT
jgi:propionate CoA-transferase